MSKPIRVLQVFARMDRGGAETMVMNLYRNIDRSKVQFDFVVHTEEKCAFDDEIKELGGNLFSVPRYVGKNHFNYKNSWENFFKENPNYRVIHGHVRSTASIYLSVAKKYGLKTIAHSHSTSSGKGLSAIVKNTLQFPIRHISDYLFACSQSAGEWLYGKDVYQKENFFILNNSIDIEKFVFNEAIRKKIRKKLKVENKFVIGHIGRFTLLKNHSFLVDVFKNIYERNRNVVLLLVGDGDQLVTIQDKVNDLGLSESVIFTGVRSDIPELLQAMDIFVFPSIYEGLPVTLIEAQASGLRCIVSDSITKELMVTDLVKYLSLEETIETWSNEICLNSQYIRKNTSRDIRSGGYDISESSQWLMNFYLRIAN